MSKKIDFEIQFLKEIEKCRRKADACSANGMIARDYVFSLNDIIIRAEIASKERHHESMLSLFNEMKALRS